MALIRGLIPSAGFYSAPDINFNTAYGVGPGDQIVLPAETAYIEINNAPQGVTFINERLSAIGEFKMGTEVKGVGLLGGNVAGMPYGILMNNPARFAGEINAKGNLRFSGIEIAGSSLGLHIDTLPPLSGPIQSNPATDAFLLIEDMYIHNTQYEALYIGHDQLGGVYYQGTIRRVKIRNVGNDGIQTRNGAFWITDNDIDGTGLGGDSNHSHGILIGGNSTGRLIARNKLRNIGFYGVFLDGYGVIELQNNDVESNDSAVLLKNTEYPGEDKQGIGYQHLILKGNRLVGGNGKSLEVYCIPEKNPMTVDIYSDNITPGTLSIQHENETPGVTVNRIATDANNIFALTPAVVVCKVASSFEAAGITSQNTEIIYLVGSPNKSYVPGRAINAITGFEAGLGYYIVPKLNMNLSHLLMPPIPSGSLLTNTVLKAQVKQIMK